MVDKPRWVEVSYAIAKTRKDLDVLLPRPILGLLPLEEGLAPQLYADVLDFFGVYRCLFAKEVAGG